MPALSCLIHGETTDAGGDDFSSKTPSTDACVAGMFSHEASPRIRSEASNNCYTSITLHLEDGNLNIETGRGKELFVELELIAN
jgi:hypothetical protein